MDVWLKYFSSIKQMVCFTAVMVDHVGVKHSKYWELNIKVRKKHKKNQTIFMTMVHETDIS